MTNKSQAPSTKFQNKWFVIWILLFGILLNWSCEKTEDIVDFPSHKSALVVNCFFNPDSAWKFEVSKSLSILDNAPLANINNAIIEISEDGNVVEILSTPGPDELYRSSNKKPVAGKNYSINVTADGFESVTAADRLPIPVPIAATTAKIIDTSSSSFGPGYLDANMSIKFNDPPEENNFYEVTIYISSDNIAYPFGLYSDDPSIEGDYRNMIFSDLLFDGQTYEISFNFEDYDFYPTKTYYIMLSSLSQANYLYKKTSILFFKRQGDPFAEPVQIYNNIEGGFGTFSGYAAAIDSVSL